MKHRMAWVWSLVALAGAALAQDGPLTGKEIEAEWVGKELSGVTPTGAKFWMSFKPDGSAQISRAPSFNDTGSWRLIDTGYCAKWAVIRQGAEACFTVRRNGTGYITYNAEGAEAGRIHAVKPLN